LGQAITDVLTLGSVVAAPFTAGTSLAWLPGALGGVGAVSGMISSQNNQNQENAAYQTALTNQGNTAGQETSLAQQLAQGPSFQSLLDAQKSGVNTFRSEVGGVPNPGAAIQDLFGQGVENALQASIGTRNSALEGAGAMLNGAGNTYGNIGGSVQRAAGAQGNPLASGAATLAGILKPGAPPGPPTAGTPGNIFNPTLVGGNDTAPGATAGDPFGSLFGGF